MYWKFDMQTSKHKKPQNDPRKHNSCKKVKIEINYQQLASIVLVLKIIIISCFYWFDVSFA